MPIPLPNLDDRRWADLVEDGRAQIPRYAPQWTDHNASDPGITIIDLFAWLAEMTNYRLNRVPARHKRKFLRLLGYQTAPPAAANVMLSFSPASGAPFLLPAGTELEGIDPDRQRIPSRTLRDTTVSAVAMKALLVDDGTGTQDRTEDFSDGLPIAALGENPQLGAALYLGFDAMAAGVPLALGFRFAGPGNDAQERRRILEEYAAQQKACQPVRTRIQCGAELPEPAVSLPQHHSARTIWEIYTASGWAPVSVFDETRSLTLDGIVEFTAPANVASVSLAGIPMPLYYLRCRFVSGAFDAVPMLLDIAVNAAPSEQSVPSVEAFEIKSGIVPTGSAPAPGDTVRLALTVDEKGVIQSLNFAAAVGPLVRVWAYEAPGALAGRIALDLELTGIGTGSPDQQVSVREAPFEIATAEVYTLDGTRWQSWTIREDFDASSRIDFTVVADATTGLFTFGSGERGQVPPPNALIFVRYRSTAAQAGNLAANSIHTLRQSPVNDVLLQSLPPSVRNALNTISTNRAAAQGGAAAETLEHALGRAVEILHAHERLTQLAARMKSATLDQIDGETVRSLRAPERGVNLLDLERLALSVPGTRVRRARAWASLYADFPCLDAPGIVTLVVVPEAPAHMPVPSPGLLDALWRYLNRRRMVCTVLQVTGPEYVEISITATVQSRTGAGSANVMQRIETALQTFLDPLAGGPDSLGWPFGRSVYRSEILQLIQNIPGVDHVVTFSMQAGTGGAQCADIALCPMALTRSGVHQIEVL